MPSIPHVHRRGAVYYWRRRLPKPLCRRLGTHFVLSLNTTNQGLARQIAMRLDDEALRMFQTSHIDHRITPDQIKAIFREVALNHLDKLDRVAVFDRLQPSFDVEESRCTDRAMGYAYRLLASRGAGAEVDPIAAQAFTAEGLTDVEIARVAFYLSELRRNNMHRDRACRLEALLAAVGAPVSPINLGIAQNTKHRAMAAALLDTRRRWDVTGEDDAVLLGAVAREAASAPPSDAGLPTTCRPSRAAETSAPGVTPAYRPVAQTQVKDEFQTTNPPSSLTLSEPAGGIVVIAETLLAGSMRNVENKTKRQVRSAAGFFARYLEEVHDVTDLRDLRQSHLAGFVNLLQNEAYVHHGKSEHDGGRSIKELRAIWKTKPTPLIGIDKPTADRWSGHLKQLFRAARGVGVIMDRDLTFEGLIMNTGRSKRARDARPTMSVTQTEHLFRQPPFVGCKAWDELTEPGPSVFHCGVYFATMLIAYGGERREEICGALVTDVILNNGPVPYLSIAKNKYRRLKNTQSERAVPLHPELLRLGFLDYVDRIKGLGYDLLFPDLYSPTTQSPLGDRLHDQLRPILNNAGITAKGTGMHSSRRGFGNNLKQNQVDAEKRAELLGHGGDTETTERYCNAYEIEILYGSILSLPAVTKHLEPRPIELIPWVAAKAKPPFSHSSRTKLARAQRTTKQKKSAR